MDQQNVAEKLRARQTLFPSREAMIGTLVTAVVLVMAATGVWALVTTNHTEAVAFSASRSAGQHTEAAAPAAPVIEATAARDDSWTVTAPAPENHYNQAGPVQCPAGTVANAVDSYGNESSCQATHNGQPCVAYDDHNKCTQWYKP